MDYILKGNEMMRRHAEERHRVLKQIIILINEMESNSSPEVNDALLEAVSIQDEIDNLESQILSSDDRQLYFKLNHLNKMIKILDQREERRVELIDSVMQIDANLLARDELIDIMKEYVDMEEAAIHRLVAELSEAQTTIEEYNAQLNTYEKLSKHDPRFKALEIINKHPQGMSKKQLAFMLGTSQYEARKVITELTNFGMIESRSDDSELIHSSESIETGVPIDLPDLEIKNTN